MTLTMRNLEELSLAGMEEFLSGSRTRGLRPAAPAEDQRFIEQVLRKQHYGQLAPRIGLAPFADRDAARLGGRYPSPLLSISRRLAGSVFRP